MLTRIDNIIAGLPALKEQCQIKLEHIKVQFENAKKEVEKAFSKEQKNNLLSKNLDYLLVYV